MIEMPEAITLAAQLNNTIKETAERIVTNYTPHKFAFFSGDTAEYDDLICGKTVKSASAFGGHIIISFDGAEIRFCDGAFPRYNDAESKPPEKHQLLIGFTDGSAITVTIAMYGFMGVYLENAMNGDAHYSAAKNAIPPVSDKFDFEYFKGLLDEKTIKLSAKAFLATEQRIPGLGNGVLRIFFLMPVSTRKRR
ncbi:MAG: hypothetical protein LBT88_03105 [Oscillospiraceae bacterium]|jgi:formamidopyrimidine-DNA glycosylase|nr:hypothetical protein [Oscillospiraceae bacterium]